MLLGLSSISTTSTSLIFEASGAPSANLNSVLLILSFRLLRGLLIKLNSSGFKSIKVFFTCAVAFFGLLGLTNTLSLALLSYFFVLAANLVVFGLAGDWKAASEDGWTILKISLVVCSTKLKRRSLLLSRSGMINSRWSRWSWLGSRLCEATVLCS